MKKKKIKIPIYELWFILVLYKNTEEIEKFFGSIDYETEVDVNQFDGAILTHNDKCYFLLEEGASPGTIAHEAKHLVNHVFTHIRCELDRHNDEPECYLLGWIVDEIHKLI